jgi:hypothetical protein
MSESFRTTPSDQPWSSSASPGNGYQSAFGDKRSSDEDAGEAGKVVLAGILGGLLSAAGYLIYRRLPDEQTGPASHSSTHDAPTAHYGAAPKLQHLALLGSLFRGRICVGAGLQVER